MAINAPQRGYLFNEAEITTPDVSAFDLSYRNMYTCNTQVLMPTLVQEVMPNDTFEIHSSYFLRAQPLVSPLMDMLDIRVFTGFIPNRLLWSNWNEFISNGDGKVNMRNAASYVAPAHPYLNFSTDDDYVPVGLRDREAVSSPLSCTYYGMKGQTRKRQVSLFQPH